MTDYALTGFPRKLVGLGAHAIYLGESQEHSYISKYWIRGYSGYRHDDEVPLYVEHIRRAVVQASNTADALLIFSGGFTADPSRFSSEHVISEAQGYHNLAEQWEWFGCPEVKTRTLIEDRARDSYENVEFSWKLFRDRTGKTPEEVIFLGFSFKKERYEFHADTIRHVSEKPSFRFEYVCVNDPPPYVIDGGARHGERATLEAFKSDPVGGDPNGGLYKKRLRRDPLGRGGYPKS